MRQQQTPWPSRCTCWRAPRTGPRWRRSRQRWTPLAETECPNLKTWTSSHGWRCALNSIPHMPFWVAIATRQIGHGPSRIGSECEAPQKCGTWRSWRALLEPCVARCAMMNGQMLACLGEGMRVCLLTPTLTSMAERCKTWMACMLQRAATQMPQTAVTGPPSGDHS